jgi:protein-arginine kinase activator protein McsA
LNIAELIEALEKLALMKGEAIKNQQYEYAAQLRDDERKYRAQLEDLMNPPKDDQIENQNGQ